MTPNRSSGFTLIEFMIAITLSLIVLAALTATFVANSRARTEIEKANDQIENGRFSLSTLSSDLELAGFLAQFNPRNAATLKVPAAKPSPCLSTVAALTATNDAATTGGLLIPIQGYNDDDATPAPAAPTTCISDVKPNTDILVIRRVATCVAGTANCPFVTNAPYFQASLCSTAAELGSIGDSTQYFRLDTNLANLNRTLRDCVTAAPVRQYIVNIYFVANNDLPGDGIPTLKRAELGGDANGDGVADVNAGGRLFAVMSIAHGIQDFQVEYGIDTDFDGRPDVYTPSPDTYNPLGAAAASCTANGAQCLTNWTNVTAAKITLLARNTAVSPDYTDNKVYTLGMRSDGFVKCANDPNNDRVCDAFGDHYKRHVYQATVRLNNLASRREL